MAAAPGYSPTFVSIADLYVAYRKAKTEAFYEKSHFHAIAFVEYEQRLHHNLLLLLQKLRDPQANWSRDTSFHGGYSYVPKSADEHADDEGIYFREVDPIKEWADKYTRNSGQPVTARFRLIIVASVELQIVSALWILRVGYKFDARLDPASSFGNRLRTSRRNQFMSSVEDRVINPDSIGLFSPYFAAYQQWRERGLRSMRNALKAGESIFAITMDVQQFYHRVNPQFLLRQSFLTQIGVHLDADETRFTNDLLVAIETWYRTTPDYATRPLGAIPVGLSASKVISNVLMHEFDEQVKARLRPFYYGRYVDDIFLVMRREQSLVIGTDVLRWLAKQLSDLLEYEENADIGPLLRLRLPYAEDSELIFAGKKQKIFTLKGGYGTDLVDHIAQQIRNQSSEHRLLPEIPLKDADMANRALMATPDATLEADALRKADVVSIRRFGFSLLLRDVESYARDLAPATWRSLRNQFYGLVHRYLLTPKGYFDYVGYLHRVFGLMIACEDWEQANEFLRGFDAVTLLLRTTTTAADRDAAAFESSRSLYVKGLLEAALQASTVQRFKFQSEFLKLLRLLGAQTELMRFPITLSRVKRMSEQILLADWGRRPYKDFWYYSQARDIKGPQVPAAISVRRFLRLASIRNFRKIADLHVPYWPALAFPTRPLSVSETVLIAPALLGSSWKLRAAIMALRGARVPLSSDELVKRASAADQISYFRVPASNPNIVTIAITNVETTAQQWMKAAAGKADRSLERYRKLRRLINRILEESPHPDYVVFPELSMPRRWAMGVAYKLAQNRISFLVGVEYYRKRNKLRNDCLISLTTDWPGYASSIAYLQPKLVPSHEERRELKKAPLATSLYQPTGEDATLPIYVHGRFIFGVLLCSDFTNLVNRRFFQGNVDALFVLEWNSDLKTFGSLVEASAYDIHAFIIQVNNRMFGDSRLRAPYTIEYQRDLVRVKGGISDYYVLARIDYDSLRSFQRKRTKPDSPIFKPVPIGFRMSARRQADRSAHWGSKKG